MTEENKAATGTEPLISEDERLRYIGFEVFRTPPKRDLFENEDEKNRYVERVHKKIESGEVLREDCTLCEERVSSLERVILLLASLLILGSLALPWFSAYNEIVEEADVSQTPAATEQSALPGTDTSATTAAAASDSVAAVATQQEPATPVAGEQASAGEQGQTTPSTDAAEQPQVSGQGLTGSEEVITSQVT
ncbi:MAG: hypothetical protein D6800_14680, partial [Candidatus Zixiibacteriota bacterium]